MAKLNHQTLTALDPAVETPAYDRAAIKPGIVHIGVGGFHRAHQAMYLDTLMNQSQAQEWGIIGVGVMPGDKRMQEVLASQDHLYTLVVKHPNGEYTSRVIGSLVDYLFAPEQTEAVIEAMADPGIKIVSLTVTEGGYNVHPVSGAFNLDNPLIQRDLAEPTHPASSFGLVVEALVRRRERGVAPFTVMSCDNIQGNGKVAKRMFGAFAKARDEELGEWLMREVAFPNAMVDRITPVTSPNDIDELESRFGLEDGWPVVCEPFTQWVLEDHFPLGRPAFEEVGVQLVEDVEPFELMKLRLLNASHQALTYFGYLAGYRYAHEVCQDPLFVDFLLRYMKEEGAPTLAPVPGIDLAAYQHTLIERFANPQIRDTLARLCAESSDRIPKWLVPVIRHQLKEGGPVELSASVIASWARYVEGVDEQGAPIEVVDALRDPLMAIARQNRTRPEAFIENRELFGDLADEPRFMQAYLDALSSLHARGARATLEMLVGSQGTR